MTARRPVRFVFTLLPAKLLRRGNFPMGSAKPKILLSEGSSLSSREAITALGLGGHRVELISSNPMSLGRFSRFVSHVHHAPASGADPDGYLAAVIDVVKAEKIDALIPVHEQAYLFAAARQKLPAGVGIALADFEAFEQLQSRPVSRRC
jgi:carbamoylphosphate synthase large subunit